MSLNLLPRFAIARWPFMPLRLIVGYGFMEHGFAKLAKGHDAFANILQAIGVPGPHFMAWSTILVEILGGLAVTLGAFVTLASLPMAAVLLVAMFTVHLPYGFSSIKLNAVTAAGTVRSRRAMKLTSCILPVSQPSFWVAPDHWQ